MAAEYGAYLSAFLFSLESRPHTLTHTGIYLGQVF
jgi:hypothetical protein